MLAQCRDGHLILLPAIPRQLESGSLEEMRLRGGMELSMKWKNGRVTWLRLIPDRLACDTFEIELEMDGSKEKVILEAGREFVRNAGTEAK